MHVVLEEKKVHPVFKINEYATLALLGGFLSLGFAPFNLWYLSLPALGFSLKMINASNKKDFWLKSLILFLVHYCISSYWVINTFQEVVNNELAAYILGTITLFLVGFTMAFCMASTLLLGWVINVEYRFSKIFGFLVLSLFFVLGEIIRSEFLGGYPMHLVGYMVGSSDELIQLASIGGVFSLSLVLVFLAQLLVSGGTYTLSALLLLTSVFLFGWLKINTENVDEGGKKQFNVRLVNANFTQKQLIDQNNSYQTADHYIQLSQQQGEMIPDLIVWPESVLQFYIQGTYLSNNHTDHVTSFLKDHQVLITGGASIENNTESNDIKFFSSLFTLDNNNTIQRYDKHRLVPWGEYIPLREYIPKSMANLFDVKDYTRGQGKLSMELDNGLNILPLLCAEGHFPQMLWQYQDNQNLIVMIGNEAWLAGSTEPDQYFINAKFRAVESGLPVLLVSNKGHLAAFNKYGELQAHAYNIEKPTILDVSIQVES